MITTFLYCFVPLFVAVDALGLLPIYVGLVEGMERARERRVIAQSVATALAVSLGFAVLGPEILNFLGVKISDFLIAGGILLFLFSVSDMLSLQPKLHPTDLESIGAVPLGVPLMAGPAVLTTVMLLARKYGWEFAIPALVANILIVGALFWMAEPVHRLMGHKGAKIATKISGLLLATYGVMLVRSGVVALMADGGIQNT
jgi:multiple antibiotic resistance protein